MRRQLIDPDGFEAKFQRDLDPWNYVGSAFEAHKRDVLRKACGSRHYGRGLELACAIGVTTLALAQICQSLLAVDSSETALAEAARRTKAATNVALRRVVLPKSLPKGPFDLIVASEILYYLPERDAMAVMVALRRALAPGGRLVLLHHVRDFDDAAQKPWRAQDKAAAFMAKTSRPVFAHAESRFRAAAFTAPR